MSDFIFGFPLDPKAATAATWEAIRAFVGFAALCLVVVGILRINTRHE